MRGLRCSGGLGAGLGCLPLLVSCLAAPPEFAYHGERGVVRGASDAEAREVSRLLEDLQPRVLELLPASGLEGLAGLEVWMQDEPHLYHFPQEAALEAEGLFAPGHDRILISRHAQDVERVLAHELVHAALGEDWQTLPGTLEEGLCDCVAARLELKGSERLRAGRLSSAALACGGLRLELEVRQRGSRDSSGLRLGWNTRITLASDESLPEAHLDVFRISAGRSSSRLSGSVKRGFYGLSYLLIDRVVARRGLEGLLELCQAARQAGHRRVPRPWLLSAAGLGEDADSWRRAAVSAMGQGELVELVRMYPSFVIDVLVERLASGDSSVPAEERLAGIEAELRLVEGTASVMLTDLDFVREAVLDALRRP